MIKSPLGMAGILPFRATRYNLRKIKVLEKVVAPPYDCISPLEQKALYRKSPYNCVRLILRKGSFTRSAGPLLYKAAARDLKRWKSGGVLVKDAEPSCYLYEQRYTAGGHHVRRKGLFVLIALSSGKRKIVPHERTLSAPKKDRFELTKATRTNLSAIFGLYRDPGRRIERLTRDARGGRPLFTVRGQDGVLNSLWQVRDPKKLSALTRALGTKRIWIADGHHRFETAVEYNHWARSRGLKLNTGYILACLVAMEDPGLRIFAIHRLIRIRDRDAKSDFLRGLRQNFNIRSVASLVKLLPLLEKRSAFHNIGMTDGRGFYLVTARRRHPGDLDVEFLDRKIMRPLMERAHLKKGTDIQFEHEPAKAVRRVARGEFDYGVFLAPTTLKDLRRRTGQGKRLPEKSTYFYPKILSGLVFNELEN
ncbi:MAG: DUF1015 domain-containing protein [Candidatus Omnitrophica bacterium]|nr:DUF1015 domain-containing protein [Candidatus Omnitrophota bacterium]